MRHCAAVLPLLVCGLVLLSGCEEEDPYGLPQITNNELSSQWVGRYEGRAVLTLGGAEQGAEYPAVVRIYDLGDNYIRVKVYLTPTFFASEQERLDVPVASGVSCTARVNVEELWWFCNFNRAADRLAGSIAVYPVGGSAANPDWVISGIDAVRE